MMVARSHKADEVHAVLPIGEFDFGADAPTWLAHCAEGPVPRASMRAVEQVHLKELRPWLVQWEEDLLGLPARARLAGARLLGVSVDQVSLVPNTSTGLITVARGLERRTDGEVLTPLGEFPANHWPWRAAGWPIREVPLWDGHRAGTQAERSTSPQAGVTPERALLDAIGPNTQVMAVSWVRFQDGLRLDLRALADGCAARGVLLVVDGIQGAGTLPLDLNGVGAFCTGGHKGLLAPAGLGLLWVNPAVRDVIQPPGSWFGVEDAANFDRANTDYHREHLLTGERYEYGVPSLLGCAGLAPSLELLAKHGVAQIAAHIALLQGRLLAALRGGPWDAEAARLQGLLGEGRLGSILALRSPAAQEWVTRGVGAGIAVTAREGYLRVAFHGWHAESDVIRALRWMHQT